MTTIQYREIILDGCRHAEIVDEQPPAQSEQEQQAYQAFAEAFPHFKPRQS